MMALWFLVFPAPEAGKTKDFKTINRVESQRKTQADHGTARIKKSF